MTDYALAVRAASELDLDGKRRLLDYLTTSIMDAETQQADDTQPAVLRCDECGKPMFLTDDEVSHHADENEPEGIDHDADADHVAHTTDEITANVWVESLYGDGDHGPYTDEIAASLAMDDLGLNDDGWKIVIRS